ncbi:MAG: hypothetical protein AABW50_03760 [Nanoarchaeota archaeon]
MKLTNLVLASLIALGASCAHTKNFRLKEPETIKLDNRSAQLSVGEYRNFGGSTFLLCYEGLDSTEQFFRFCNESYPINTKDTIRVESIDREDYFNTKTNLYIRNRIDPKEALFLVDEATEDFLRIKYIGYNPLQNTVRKIHID